MTRRIAHAAQIGALVLALALVPVALAAKGGSHGGGGTTSGSSSISIAEPLVYDANGDGLPNWGDTIRFNVSTTVTTEPFVELICYQNGVAVYGANTGYFDSYSWPSTQNMKLGSQMWTGGNADCVASMFTFRNGHRWTLATLSFTAFA
jgi:hypothetical protein